MQLQRAGSDVLNIANSGAYNYTLSATDNPAYTITNNGSGNIVTNLASTGNIIYQDNGSTFLTLSNTGGFDLSLDATDDPTFTVTNNGAGDVTFNLNDTGDFILQDSGTATLTITETGATTFKNSADSTTAFLIQKAGSTVELLTVDTSNNRVYIGDVAADTTGTLLILDSKSDAGDPTGVNGGSYYNSNSNYFRCFQNGLWQNCLPSGNSEAIIQSGPVTWTNQPAADTEFTGTPRTIVDLTNARQFRFVMRAAVAGFAGSDCRVQYSATDAGVYANLDGGAGPELAITATTQASAWTDIVAGARADIFLRVMCKQGNGIVDPQFRTLKIDYR
jgi:hypothetical protein